MFVVLLGNIRDFMIGRRRRERQRTIALINENKSGTLECRLLTACLPSSSLRLRLHGTGQIFDRSKICTVHLLFKRNRLFFWLENVFRLHETGYFEIVLRTRGYLSATYHVNMRCSKSKSKWFILINFRLLKESKNCSQRLNYSRFNKYNLIKYSFYKIE